VTDQDGRHRALLAQQEGLDAIPVAVKKTGQAEGGGEPTEIQGMDGTILPHTFPKADTVPKSLFRQAVDAVIPSAEAAEPARQASPNNPYAEFVQPSQTSAAPKTNPYAEFLPPEQRPPDNMVVSGAKGVMAGMGKAISGGEELIGKGLEAASDSVSPPQPTLSGQITGAEPQRGMVGRAGEFLVDNARKRIGRIDDYTGADMKAHPWVTGEAEVAGNLAMQLALTKGKGGVGKTNAMRAVSGGALTALLDPVGSDEGGYWWAKALAVGVDASMGMAGNALAERVAKWIEPQMRPIREFIERVTGKSVKQNPAAAAVIDRMEKDARAGGPTAQDMIDLANKTPDKPLTIADVGGPEIQGLTGRVVRAPGEGRAKLTNFLNKRDEGAGERLAEDINRDIGRDSSYQLAKTMKTSRAAAAEPLYEAAYAHPPISPDEMVPSGGTQRAGSIGALLDRPSVRAGIANARKIAKEEGVDLSTLGVDLDPQGVPVFTKVPTWKALDYIKRGIDDVVEQFRDPTSGRLALDDYGHAANATRTEFRNALKQLNPKYANALDAYSGASTSLDALHAGEDFLKRSPEEIADRVATFGTGDREFYRLGAANTLRRAVQKAKFSADEAKAIINSQDMRNQIRPLFDNDADFARFVDSVFAEGRMFGTRFNALGGSQTAARRAEDTSPEIEGLVHAARGMLHAKTGNAMGVVNALRGVREAAAAARQRKANPGIADILTTPIDPTGAGVRDFASHMASPPNSALNATRNRLAQLSRAAGPAIGVGVANQLGPQQQPGGQ
jgi:hypothetical protein